MSKRCLGCMELFGDEFEICPHCGYVVGTPAEEAIHIEPGSLLNDRYIVGKVLGYGGFGVTYIGWDGKLEQKVAIKEYLPGEFSTRMPGQSQVTVFNGEKSEQFHDGLKKFVEEAKHLAKFQNEHGIVKIFDSFEENDTAYIIMEYLDGETLTSYLKREKTIPEDVAVEMMMPVMESLQIVHDAGLLHRDIAPDNIFLTKNGEVKLIDFGASRYATTSHSRSLTVIIKPGYSPEEQYRSRGDQGPYTDVYAVSATLYKMITGKTPPDAMERRAKYENQNKDILEEPRKINKKISLNRENAILNAMNVRIEDRTPDLATFIKDLNADPPVKRVYGKIKKIDLYSWPLWLKILVPSLLSLVLVFGALLLTGVISFSNFTEEIVIPENIMTVPDVEGMYKDEALKQISDNHLLPSTDGSVESEYIPAGKIVLQTPVGGSYMDTNGIVMLMISSGKEVASPENGISTVPYVIWDTKDDAVAKLLKAGLAEPEIIEINDENVAYGSVISQSPDAGTKVDEGTVIKLTVSIGPSAFEIPDVVGKSRDEAESLLNEKGLSVSVEYVKNDSVPENEVIKQSVSAGTSVKRGDKVLLTISSGRETINVADVAGKSKDEAEDILEDQGFKVKVLENYDAEVKEGNVISQSPAAGTSQLPDSTVVIYVSKGKQPVTITWDGNGGYFGDPNKTIHIDGPEETGYLASPIRTGYDFAYWSFSKSGGTSIPALFEPEVSCTLYAQWTPKTYTVTLDTQGSATSSLTRTVTFGAGYTGIPSPSRSGYTFLGWSLKASGGSIINSSTIVSTASDHKLYAQWKANTYLIRLHGNGVSYTATKPVTYGEAYGTLPVPKRDYYDFVGWFTKKEGGVKVTESTVMNSTFDMDYYAHWTEKSPTYWVLASNVPQNAKIVSEKWTYTYTETTQSESPSLSGWIQRGSSWSKTGSGTHIYGSFPSAFDKNNTYYTNWNGSALKASETATTKREVSAESFKCYVYWHWSYPLGGTHSEGNRYIGDYYNEYINGCGYATIFEAFDSTSNPAFNSDANAYKITGHSNYSYWWLKDRVNIYTQTYTDYKKIFEYYRSTEKESTTQVNSGAGISNIQKWVKYIPV